LRSEYLDDCEKDGVSLCKDWNQLLAIRSVYEYGVTFTFIKYCKGFTGPEKSWNSSFNFSGPERYWIGT